MVSKWRIDNVCSDMRIEKREQRELHDVKSRCQNVKCHDVKSRSDLIPDIPDCWVLWSE